jgi:hypothetical protein
VFRVVQKFGVVDRFGTKALVAEVEYRDLPVWVDALVTKVDRGVLRLALDRYADRLLSDIRYTPKQCLDRVPVGERRCVLWEGCFGWKKSTCTNLKKNTCPLLQMPDVNAEWDGEITDLVNLWRDKYHVVRVQKQI